MLCGKGEKLEKRTGVGEGLCGGEVGGRCIDSGRVDFLEPFQRSSKE